MPRLVHEKSPIRLVRVGRFRRERFGGFMCCPNPQGRRLLELMYDVI